MPGHDPPAELAQALLSHLREALALPQLSYAEPPQPLTGGFDTAVYSLRLGGAPPPFDVPLVVRVFPPGDSPARGRFEAAIQGSVAAQGFPAPPVVFQCTDVEPLGSPFIIMTRAPGRRLLDTLMGASFFRVPGILADTHLRLHALDPRPIRESLAAAGLTGILDGTDAWLAALRAELEADGLDAFAPALAWLESHCPRTSREPVLCHLDFHPLNILVKDGAVTGVIDWPNAAFGDPAADVGVTRVLMTLGPLDALPFLGGVLSLFRRLLAWQYTRAYRNRRPIPMDAIRYYEALRCFAAMLHVARLRRGGLATSGYAWDDPGVSLAMSKRFRSISGVALPRVARTAGASRG